jgi:ribosomal-protein-alanine N-acetyltransferase
MSGKTSLTVTRFVGGADGSSLAPTIDSDRFPELDVSLDDELTRPFARIWVGIDELAGPIGLLVAWHVADELQILDVATSTAHRRRGVGTTVIRAAIKDAARDGVQIALLEVRRSNASAIGLYRKLGFDVTGERARYYGDNGEDALEMALKINADASEFAAR